ncbi:MAG: diguanylate cyclase [Candidatus Cloacimonetes bacterium]|nr:diguanylate cyclase [Candidatus Cloacimonadota bacterium]
MKIFLTFYLFFSCLTLLSLNPDSLTKETLPGTGSERLHLLNRLAADCRDENPQTCIDYAQEACELAAELSDNPALLTARCNLAGGYYLLGSYNKALLYYQEALELAEKLSDSSAQTSICREIGTLYFAGKQYEEALACYLRSLEIGERLGDKNAVASSVNSIGLTYLQLADLDLAEQYLQRSLKLSETEDDRYGIAITSLNLGRIFLTREDLLQARASLERALNISTEINAGNLQLDSYYLLADLCARNRDFEQALLFYRNYSRQKDMLYGQDRADEQTGIQLQYETESTQNELSRLKRSYSLYLTLAFCLILLAVVAALLTIIAKYRLKEHLLQEMNLVNEQLRQIARTDALTNLANRRGMQDKIEYEKYRMERNKKSFVLIMGDIDNFKVVNDTYGHDCGDFILRSLANFLVSLLRKQDIVSRWGGDEFLLLLPETDLNGGLLLAEKLRRQIQDYEFYYKGVTIRITITFGVVAVLKPEKINEKIEQADKALYLGKNSGKNCVIS